MPSSTEMAEFSPALLNFNKKKIYIKDKEAGREL